MRVLLINGSPREKGCTFTALCEIAGELEDRGIEAEIFHIGTSPVGGCIDCGKCEVTKRCVFDDCVNIALKKADAVDGFVFGAPVYFASPNGSMISFMDRFFHIGDFTHKPAAVVTSARRGGTTASLDVLLKYPSMMEMPMVSANYWNMVHGNTPEEVKQDLEGLYTMRMLGRNMAWLLKCIELGKEQGILPVKEKKEIWTNFI